ncbi:plant intracellular ras-group-related lrr protein 9 [Gigaspora margarita]|uniref:Plant intracellular ras-group-related lrr protein 9 n=1 Tax=Gigaspora margarita TaxID=4874 RepID=A0A8H3X0S6_GIGMA|nr:plant intracellular ras-group-related lrr protein 9 [Gigaspora margarita]
MVDANQYINQHYPPSANRLNIKTLDVSNNNLTNIINLGPSENFTNIVELNTSFNQIIGFSLGVLPQMRIMDFSHNLMANFIITNSALLPKLSIINFSYNLLSDIGPGSVILTHLDISNNLLTRLDLQNCKNLVALNCSANPNLSILILHSSFDPSDSNNFDCRGTSIGQINTTSFIFDCRTGTRTLKNATVSQSNNNASNHDTLYIGIIIGMGIIIFGGILFLFFWFSKRRSTSVINANYGSK